MDQSCSRSRRSRASCTTSLPCSSYDAHLTPSLYSGVVFSKLSRRDSGSPRCPVSPPGSAFLHSIVDLWDRRFWLLQRMNEKHRDWGGGAGANLNQETLFLCSECPKGSNIKLKLKADFVRGTCQFTGGPAILSTGSVTCD